MEYALPCYSADQVMSCAPHYFPKVTAHRGELSRLIVGKPRVAPFEPLTYFVARQCHRTPHRVEALQHGRGYQSSIREHKPVWRGQMKPRTMYRTTLVDYVIACVDWRSGQVQEIALYPSRLEAVQALSQMNLQ